jgi:hypothetical protein
VIASMLADKVVLSSTLTLSLELLRENDRLRECGEKGERVEREGRRNECRENKKNEKERLRDTNV